MEKNTLVKISDNEGFVKYINDNEEGSNRIQSHYIEDFVRSQELTSDRWSSKYLFVMYAIIIGSANNTISLMTELVTDLSGGVFLIFLCTTAIIFGIPLIYMEMFIGRYTKLTNCQMYRMAPIFYGVFVSIYFINVLYQPLMSEQSTEILVNLLTFIINGNIYGNCTTETRDCYDYKIKGPLNNACESNGISVDCETGKKIRFPMEYHNWKTYRDTNSKLYPYYQIIIGVVISWCLILSMVVKTLGILGKILSSIFVIQFVVLTVIFALSLTQNGGKETIKILFSVDFNKLDLYSFLLSSWYSLSRLGIIIPTGYMTSSAYYELESTLSWECCIIVVFSLLVAIYYLAVIFSVASVISHAMGVTLNTVLFSDIGVFVVLMPEFLDYMQLPSIAVLLYYFTVWFTETVRMALYIHMLVLNLYDYFPTAQLFAGYVWVAMCIILCLISISLCNQYFNLVLEVLLIKSFVLIFPTIAITLETTMVSYFYGVRRLCNDIHFMDGEKPTRFWQAVWYLFPIFGWGSLASLGNVFARVIKCEEDHDFCKEATLFFYIFYIILFLITIIITIMYISVRIGTPNLWIRLVNPQYFWGPTQKDVRVERKIFYPDTSIRSEVSWTVEKEHEMLTGSQYVTQFAKNPFQRRNKVGGIVSDKRFLAIIDIHSELNCRNKNNSKEQRETEFEYHESEKPKR